MYNNSPSPIMVISGEKGKRMLKKAETPIGNHTQTVKRAKEKLGKMSTVRIHK